LFELSVLNVRPQPPIETGDKHLAETRQQLLAAAAEVFAEVGFRDATVREICRRAGANIAAVNYHFGDKEALYAEVLSYTHHIALDKHPLLPDVGKKASPENQLEAFVRSFLARIFDDGPVAWHGKLMAREMIEPTAALDSLVEERFRPMSLELRALVARILDCPMDDERVRLSAFSVVSQCVFYSHCRPVVCRLFPKQEMLNAAGIARLANHITEFSLAAMKNLPPPKP
jgi:AcrR family transcriptional regulator